MFKYSLCLFMLMWHPTCAEYMADGTPGIWIEKHIAKQMLQVTSRNPSFYYTVKWRKEQERERERICCCLLTSSLQQRIFLAGSKTILTFPLMSSKASNCHHHFMQFVLARTSNIGKLNLPRPNRKQGRWQTLLPSRRWHRRIPFHVHPQQNLEQHRLAQHSSTHSHHSRLKTFLLLSQPAI